MLFGKQVIEQSRTYPAYMQGAGWTRRKPYPYSSFHRKKIILNQYYISFKNKLRQAFKKNVRYFGFDI